MSDTQIVVRGEFIPEQTNDRWGFRAKLCLYLDSQPTDPFWLTGRKLQVLSIVDNYLYLREIQKGEK